MPDRAEDHGAQAQLLYRTSAIAAYLRISERQVRHLASNHGLPLFTIGGTVCANRSSIDAWSIKMEAVRDGKDKGLSR